MEKIIKFKNKKIIDLKLFKIINLKEQKNNQNNNDNILKNQINNYKNKIFILFRIIMIYLIIPFSYQNYIYNHRLLESEDLDIINLIINVSETGEQEIINLDFNDKPNYIYVNGSNVNISDNYKISLEKNIYSITLKWNYAIIILDNMFSGLINIIEIDFSNFNTSQVYSMKFIFKDCINLKKITFGNKFDTSLTNTMYLMFENCNSLTSLNLSSFNTSNVNEMGAMFLNCFSLEYLDISNFNTSKVKNFDRLFSNCKSLKSLDLHSFNTEIVENMNEMFSNCYSLTSLDISSFNTKSVSRMNKMFMNCYLLTSLDLSDFDTSLITQMECFFEGCKSLTSIDVSNFNTSSCNTMRRMFINCELLSSLDLSNFNTSIVTNMEQMFNGCISLLSLDLSNFNTSKVTSFSEMFDSCFLLKSLDVSNFNTNQGTDFTKMFNDCRSLKSIDLSNFNTDKIIKLEKIFNNCYELTTLDLSNFNTSNAINMKSMFRNCINLTSLNLSNFNTLLVEDMTTMFEGCIKLNYINIKEFRENITLITTDMFTKTPDNLIYCINNEDLTPNINLELLKKDCQIKDCDYFWRENYENMIENKKKDINVIHDKCIIKSIKNISNYFYFSNKLPNISIYSYEIVSSNELKTENINLTFVEISQEQKIYLLNLYGINENEELYIFIYDAPSNDSRTATSDYNFELILENGTILSLSELKEDFYVNTTIPIRNLDLANFNYFELFSKNGYDIYNKKSNFYNDICSPAYINDNDITLLDRKKYIYPNNVTLCKENCEYKEVNIKEKRIICECNLNINNINQSKNDEDDFLDEEDDGNFINYFLDNINYKIFKCYYLILYYNNLFTNPPIYIFLIVLVLIIIFSFKFLFYGITRLRILMYKELPTELKLRKLLMKNLKRIHSNNIRNNTKAYSIKKFSHYKNEENTPIEAKKIRKNTKYKTVIENESSNIYMLNKNYNNKSTKMCLFQKENKININNNSNKKNSYKSVNKSKKIIIINEIKNNNHIKNEDSDSYNFSPYTKALREDKRNFFQIFKFFFFKKIDLLNLIFSKDIFKDLLICQYIISLILDFFFNTLLYSDDIVSHKYHNNGKLDFIVTLSLSIISNIITSIFNYFLEYSDRFNERLDEICDIKNEFIYLYMFKKFLKYIRIKMIVFSIVGFIIIILCFYYITIFSIVYSKSQGSLLINYLISLFEGLIKELIIIILIVVTRIIGIKCQNVYIFNTSKFIDEKF